MQILQSVKGLAGVLALVAQVNAPSRTLENVRFYVECYTSGSPPGNLGQDYAYRLKAQGFPERVQNGININLNQEKIVLSVDSKPTEQEEYSPLYPDLPLSRRSQQPCEQASCLQVDYEPQDFPQKLIVTYDPDKGAFSVQHAIAPDTVIEARGGCVFVALPSSKN
jgi:hypothetical protein